MLDQGEKFEDETLKKLSKQDLINKIKKYYQCRDILTDKLIKSRLEVNYLCRRYNHEADYEDEQIIVNDVIKQKI